MLERLERAHGPVELVAFAGVPDGLGQAPLGQSELLGREQSGAGQQAPAHGLGSGGRVREQGSGRTGEGDRGERTGQVERDEGPYVDPVPCGLHRVQAVSRGHQEHIGRGGLRDSAHGPFQGAGHRGAGVGGRCGERQGEYGDLAAGGKLGEEAGGRPSVGTQGEEDLGRDDGARQVGRRGDAAPQFLQDHGGLAMGGTLAA